VVFFPDRVSVFEQMIQRIMHKDREVPRSPNVKMMLN